MHVALFFYEINRKCWYCLCYQILFLSVLFFNFPLCLMHVTVEDKSFKFSKWKSQIVQTLIERMNSIALWCRIVYCFIIISNSEKIRDNCVWKTVILMFYLKQKVHIIEIFLSNHFDLVVHTNIIDQMKKLHITYILSVKFLI